MAVIIALTLVGKIKSNRRVLINALHLIILYGICTIANFSNSKGEDKFEPMHYLTIFNNLGLLMGAIIPMCIFERACIYVPLSLVYQTI